MKRVLGCFAPIGVAAVLLAGCSSNGLGVTLAGDTHQAATAGVSCLPGTSSVTVTGSFTPPPGESVSQGPITLPDGRRVRPQLGSIGPSAVVLDSAGHQIGAFNGPDVALHANRASSFKFVVPVEAGSPSSCVLSWSAGTLPVIGE
jgi:hypothetical protein